MKRVPMFKRLAFVWAASLLSGLASAEDLLGIYRDALGSDAQFTSARARAEAGREFAVQGRAGLLPNIGASGDTTFNNVDLEGQSSRNFNSNAWGVQLTQPLYRQQNVVESRQGALRSTRAEIELELARQDLILRVAEAYFRVLNAQDALQAVTTLKTASAEQLEIARTSFEVGTVTITDVHEAQSRFDLATAEVIAAESRLAVNKQSLAQIIGREAEPLARLRPGVQISEPSPNNPLDWATAAESGSIGVRLTELTRDIAAQEVERARAGHLPTVDLVASYGQGNRQTLGGGRVDSAAVGVQLNVPLYTGGALSSRDRETAALKMSAEADLDRARRDAVLAARDAFTGVTSGMAQVKALEAAEISSNSALEATRVGFEVGLRINIDVLNALTQLANTQRELAVSRYETLQAQLRLKAAAGTLDESDVAAINALLVTE